MNKCRGNSIVVESSHRIVSERMDRDQLRQVATSGRSSSRRPISAEVNSRSERRRESNAKYWALLGVLALMLMLYVKSWDLGKAAVQQYQQHDTKTTTQPTPKTAQPQTNSISTACPDNSIPRGTGCGRECSKHGQGTCCAHALIGPEEVNHYDDVPYTVRYGQGDVPVARPKHDKTVLSLGARVPGSVPLMQCYGIGGDYVAKVPSFMTKLYRVLFEANGWGYDIAARLRASEGSVLVVWIAEKFMPHQATGKNVRGEEVDAPTRGQNNSYYEKEYSAVFHTTLAEGRTTYHAQVVAREALVVCMWERLHLTLYNCSIGTGGGTEPSFLPVHFCQCRHCSDATVSTERSTDAQKYPKAGLFSTPKQGALHYVPKALPKPEEGVVNAETAPWLLPRGVSSYQFPYENLYADLKAMLQVQADANGVVTVFIFNKFWIDHLHNIVFSMVKNTGLSNYLVATLDCESLELCLKNRLPCFDAENFAETESDMKEGASGYQKGFQRKVTEELSWIKPRLALKILSLGYRFMMVDMDMSFNKNPMGDVLSKRQDFVHQCDTTGKYSINTGFYLLHNTSRAERLFQNIMVFPPHRLSDQNALKLVTKYDHTHGASSSCLDKWHYNMKCNYKVPKSEKGTGAKRTFQWKPQQRDRSGFDWYIFHATCLDGAVSKINWLRSSNAWYLDDLDKLTRRPYVLVCNVHNAKPHHPSQQTLTDAEGTVHRFPNMTRQTLHSARYPTELDPLYLQERH